LSPEQKLPVENEAVVSPAQDSPDQSRTALLVAPSAHANQETSGLQIWLHRTSVFLFVLVSAIAGVLLVILPWTPQWTDNYLLLQFPWLRDLISAGFFRGVCSGLGLLDIWIGFWEALHYHDHQ
jgi:hypothetical protein